MGWIKLDHDLWQKPEVVEMSALLDIPICHVVGCLSMVWAWADKHTENGHVSVTLLSHLGHTVGVTGFIEAMQKVGWIVPSEGGFSLPNFERHNGEGAKIRLKNAERQAKSRLSRKCHTKSVTEALPEKKRKEVNTPISPNRKPTFDEWKAKAVPRGMTESEALRTWSYYESVDWMRGKTPISKWENCITTCLKDKSQPKGSAVSFQEAREAAR
jgi:hypothetical protein